MTSVIKLNIFKDSGEMNKNGCLMPFIHMNPIYIDADNYDESRIKIFMMIANNIVDSFHLPTLDFRKINTSKFPFENKMNVPCDFNSIMKVLLDNSLLIYYQYTNKSNRRYYIELSQTSNKGSAYTDDEIQRYIFDIFNNIDDSSDF